MSSYAQLINTTGLVVDLAAIWIVASSVIVTHAQAHEVTAAGWGGVSPGAVADRTRASTKAIVGGLLFSVGIALQILATWLR